MAALETDDGARFSFGENWRRFLSTVDAEKIAAAEASLRERLGNLEGLRLLDAGSGSGLFSLAARNLGAEVVSFDYDAQSVACTEEMRQRYRADDEAWRVLQGSVLDTEFLASLGTFDVVYSWGVLHHTGRLWDALNAAAARVRPGGRLFISIYNDQGFRTRFWTAYKRIYNRSGPFGRAVLIAALIPRLPLGWIRRTLSGPSSSRVRAMSRWYDLKDWVGGWPFQTAKPDEVTRFLVNRGYRLSWTKTVGRRLGCNEYLAIYR